jgi:hypothetical protein
MYLNGNWTNRQDGPGKVFNPANCPNLTIQRVWAQHWVCGIWASNCDNALVTDCRFMDTYADGMNFTNNTVGATFRDIFTRNTGDDGIAIWSAMDIASGPNQNNLIEYCTATLPWRAACIAVYGGDSNEFRYCLCRDSITYPGITISGHNFGVNTAPFTGTTNIHDITIERCGGEFWVKSATVYQRFGGIWFYTGSSGIPSTLTVSNIDIINPIYTALLFSSLNTSTSHAEVLNNIKVQNGGEYGIWAKDMTYDGQANVVGSITVKNTTLSGALGLVKNDNPSGFTIVNGGGNNF